MKLRTPIQPILGLSQILLSKTGGIQENNELLDTINRNAKRLSRLTDDILDATKIDEDNNQIIISVKDTGSGIDPEILPRLFSKFATKSETGTGLGLFISKSIIEAHGVKIWAENNDISMQRKEPPSHLVYL